MNIGVGAANTQGFKNTNNGRERFFEAFDINYS